MKRDALEVRLEARTAHPQTMAKTQLVPEIYTFLKFMGIYVYIYIYMNL